MFYVCGESGESDSMCGESDFLVTLFRIFVSVVRTEEEFNAWVSPGEI